MSIVKPQCAPALFGVHLVVGFVFFAALRYSVLSEAIESETFAAGLYERFLGNLYYQIMVVSWISCLLYLVAVFIAFRRIVLFAQSTLIEKAAMWVCGVNSTRKLVIFDGGYTDYIFDAAISPIREANILFPAFGFIGTVIGVSLAIGGLNQVLETGNTADLLDGLRVAFDTTLIGLAASASLTLALFICEASQTRLDVSE